MSIKSAGPWAQAGPGGQPKHQKHEQLVVVANHENPAKEKASGPAFRAVHVHSWWFVGVWGVGERVFGLKTCRCALSSRHLHHS